MARGKIRFCPPKLDVSPELDWVLQNAWADQQVGTPTDGQRVFDIALKLDLAGRIGARIAKDRLIDELGQSPADKFIAAARSVAFNNLRVLKTTTRIATIAALADLPLVLLKGGALLAGDIIDIRERATGDVDVLVPPNEALHLAQVLQDHGFTFRGTSNPDHHHLAPLAGPDGVLVEIHTRLGKDLGAIDYLELTEDGELVDISLDGTPVQILSSNRMAAHLLVHAFVEHGFAPGAYPSMRWIGDLAALCDHSEISPEEVKKITQSAMSEAETVGAFSLVNHLRNGQTDFTRNSAEAVLLAHFVGQFLDDDYKKSLRLQRSLTILGATPGSSLLTELARLGHLFLANRPANSKTSSSNSAKTVKSPLKLANSTAEILLATVRTILRTKA